jgi:signal recognition particle receptor subunit beta
MVLFNYSTKELTAKIVYYGPGLCGKTTNLQYIHQQLSENVKGKMLSLATKTDRTLFFDFLPMDLGEIRGMKTRMQLYTVPGQVFYNETRKLVLKGVDGIVFVADSQKEMLGPNIESFKNLEENLKAHGLKLAELPHVIQFNKRDLPKLSSLEELNAAINKFNAPFYESVATTGIGVQDSLKAITKLVLLHLTKKYDPRAMGEARPAAAPVPVAAAAAAGGRAEAVRAQASGRASGGKRRAAATAPPAAVATIEVDEIDDLVSEVQQQPEIRVQADSTAPDDGSPVFESVGTESDLLSVGLAAEPVDGRSVRLTEALGDRDLFDDPTLEVARLLAGDVREIVIPLQVGDEASAPRRYKLSLKLRLDPVQ